MKIASTTARRALVSLAAVALSGGVLVAGTGTAAAAPGDPDITGLVVNASGTGLADVDVYAYSTPSDGSDPQYVDHASTDPTGAYSLTELDSASLASNYPGQPGIIAETEFKLYFSWYPSDPADYHSTGYLDRGLGGTKSLSAADSVVVPSGATATAPTQALPTAGGVLVKVLGATGAPVTYGEGYLYEADADDPLNAYVTDRSSNDDDDYYDPADAPVDGLVYLWGVEPGPRQSR